MAARTALSYVAVFAAGALVVVAYLAWWAPAPVAGESAAPTGATSVDSLVKNTMVTVSGTVERITDEDEFVLADATGSVRVWTGNQFFTVDQGESVVVTGFVDDGLFIEIYAQEIVRADGTVISVGGSSER